MGWQRRSSGAFPGWRDVAQPGAAIGAAALIAALGAPALAQAPPPTASARPAGGQSQLIEQARFWSHQGRNDLAIQSLQRVLQAEPENPTALYEIARAHLSQGEVATARDFAARLRRVIGEGGLYAQLKKELDAANLDQRALADARALAARGEYANAVAVYARAFKGQAPAGALAIEYYETMAGVPSRAAEARAALERLAAAEPNNRALALTLARIRSYDDALRREAIDQLLDIAGTLAFRPQALDAARQALLWLSATSEDQALFDRYFALKPDDAELKAKWAQVTEPAGVDRLAAARARAYALLEDGRIEDAEAEFDAILEEDRRDAEATAGLGVVRGRQERYAEAEDLLRRAIRLDPTKREGFEAALDAIAFGADVREARRAVERGEFALAERLLAALIPPTATERAQIALVRAEAAAKQRDWRAADRAYGEALDLAPRNDDAFAGLIAALIELREARRLEALVSEGVRASAGRSAPRARAAIAKARGWLAASRGDVRAAAAWYADALALAPEDPWLRLAAARALTAVGRGEEASALFEGAYGGRDPEMTQAAALYWADQGDWGAVERLLASIPPDQRTAEAGRLMAHASVQVGVARARLAAAGGDPNEARRALIGLYAPGAASVDETLLIAGALLEAGDQSTAALLVRQIGSLAEANPTQIENAVGILIGAEDLGLAAQTLSRFAERAFALSPAERLRFSRLYDTLAIAQARRALAEGELNRALDLLSPVYAADPGNPEALKALGELNRSAGRKADALAFYRAALDVDPNDRDSLNGAVGAAMEMGRFSEAEELLAQALLRAPADPALHLLRADLARAQGDTKTAIAALESAQRFDRGDADAMAAGALTASGDNPFRQGPTNLPGSQNPFYAAPESAAPEAPPPLAQRPTLRPTVSVPAPTAMTLQTLAAEPNAAAWIPLPYAPEPVAPRVFAGEAQPPIAGVATPRFSPIAMLAQPVDLRARLDALGAPGRAAPAPLQPSAASAERPAAYYQWTLAELRAEVSASVSQGLGMRWRDGEEGLSQLVELKAPFAFAVPLGGGRLSSFALPVFLDAGALTGDPFQLRRFGTLAATPAEDRPTPDATDAAGVGLGLRFEREGFVAELATSPLGFEVTNILGEIGYAHDFDGGLSIGASLERRSVTDSVLSYAGAIDPFTGITFGGVTETRLRARVTQSFGRMGLYLNGGFGVVEGAETDANTTFQVDAGSFVTLNEADDSSLKSGFNLTILSYEENRRYFTLGHGGYFSPQSYVAATIPLNYHYAKDRLTIDLDTALGVQYFSEDTADYFPDRGDLMRDAAPIAAEDEALGFGSVEAPLVYEEMSQTTVAARVALRGRYRLTPALAIGGEVSVDRAADWTEAVGMVRLTYWPGLDRLR